MTTFEGRGASARPAPWGDGAARVLCTMDDALRADVALAGGA